MTATPAKVILIFRPGEIDQINKSFKAGRPKPATAAYFFVKGDDGKTVSFSRAEFRGAA